MGIRIAKYPMTATTAEIGTLGHEHADLMQVGPTLEDVHDQNHGYVQTDPHGRREEADAHEEEAAGQHEVGVVAACDLESLRTPNHGNRAKPTTRRKVDQIIMIQFFLLHFFFLIIVFFFLLELRSEAVHSSFCPPTSSQYYLVRNLYNNLHFYLT